MVLSDKFHFKLPALLIEEVIFFFWVGGRVGGAGGRAALQGINLVALALSIYIQQL